MFMVFVLLAAFAGPGPAWAHGGGLDSLGCHHDRKAGGYHCHRGSLAGQYFGSQQDALKASGGGKAKQVPNEPRRCCKVCKKGIPCGDSCISARYTCRKPPGCAC